MHFSTTEYLSEPQQGLEFMIDDLEDLQNQKTYLQFELCANCAACWWGGKLMWGQLYESRGICGYPGYRLIRPGWSTRVVWVEEVNVTAFPAKQCEKLGQTQTARVQGGCAERSNPSVCSLFVELTLALNAFGSWIWRRCSSRRAGNWEVVDVNQYDWLPLWQNSVRFS